MTLNTLSTRLKQYEEQEARSVVRLLLFNVFGIGLTELCCGALNALSPEQQAQLEMMMKELENGVPVQYVTGKAEFYGRDFHVSQGVLIPRPETEELIKAVLEKLSASVDSPMASVVSSAATLDILDIGTGSGCIAITLAKELPHANVTAWDVSDDALTIARHNSVILEAEVKLEKVDVLRINERLSFENTGQSKRWNVIISNPPYICNKEKADMEALVLDNEPDIALFVPDEDPLLFYRTIANYATLALKDNGVIAFEINPIYAVEMIKMMKELSFNNIDLIEDQFGKQRILLATH